MNLYQKKRLLLLSWSWSGLPLGNVVLELERAVTTDQWLDHQRLSYTRLRERAAFREWPSVSLWKYQYPSCSLLQTVATYLTYSTVCVGKRASCNCVLQTWTGQHIYAFCQLNTTYFYLLLHRVPDVSVCRHYAAFKHLNELFPRNSACFYYRIPSYDAPVSLAVCPPLLSLFLSLPSRPQTDGPLHMSWVLKFSSCSTYTKIVQPPHCEE